MFEIKIVRTKAGAVASVEGASGRAAHAEALRFAADVEELSGLRRWAVSVACVGSFGSEVRITLGDGPRCADTVEEAERALRLVELERAREAFRASQRGQEGSALARLEAASDAAYDELRALGTAG